MHGSCGLILSNADSSPDLQGGQWTVYISVIKPQEEKPTWIIILYWPYSPAS